MTDVELVQTKNTTLWITVLLYVNMLHIISISGLTFLTFQVEDVGMLANIVAQYVGTIGACSSPVMTSLRTHRYSSSFINRKIKKQQQQM
jgi:hypothetical protein